MFAFCKSYETGMSPTMVSFGNGARAATFMRTRQTEGTAGAINLVPVTRHAPLRTLYVRLPEEDELKSFARGVLLVVLTTLAICQIGKKGPTASEITNCLVPALVYSMPTRMVRRESACDVVYERLVAFAIAVQSAGTSIAAGPADSQRYHFTLFTSEMLSRFGTSFSPIRPFATICGEAIGGKMR